MYVQGSRGDPGAGGAKGDGGSKGDRGLRGFGGQDGTQGAFVSLLLPFLIVENALCAWYALYTFSFCFPGNPRRERGEGRLWRTWTTCKQCNILWLLNTPHL